MNEPNTLTKFNYNPFSGVDANDVHHIIVPQFDMDVILNEFQSDKPRHIELLGKQGRGKTTHLKWLAGHFPEIPLYLLHSDFDLDTLIADDSELLFIDSIHHLSFKKRIDLFRAKKTIVFTTHWSRNIETKIANKNLLTIKFKGIKPEVLKSIIDKRLSLAATSTLESDDFLSTDEVNELIRKYKDNYRGIINYLYDKYQL